jgi:diaminopimelate epimerase
MAGMRFAKAHSLGNDFLLVEGSDQDPAASALASALCDRQRGIGADGLVVYRVGEGPGARFSMRVYNRDGSEAEMSGNGLRCLGAYLKYSGRVPEETFAIETAAGERSLVLVESSGARFLFRAGMGSPRLASRETLSVGGREVEATLVSLGNPHCVVFVARLDFDELRRLGPLLERHSRFPQRSNVELVELRTPSEIRVGFWERGVGETSASGTGACGAAVAAILHGKVGEKVTVVCPGGRLEVWWQDRGEVYLTGEAILVAEGNYLGRIE